MKGIRDNEEKGSKPTMSEEDFRFLCSVIDREKEFLNSVSQDIWKTPELAYEEFHAHDVLTDALTQLGFQVEKHYKLPTAFKAEYASKTGTAPVIAIILEYDALPGIGHACGHNLIAEAGLAASLAIKEAMDADPKLEGKLLVLGTPAEERRGGKIDLLEAGAFQGVDAAMMVHPSKYTSTFPPVLSRLSMNVDFKGKEAHAAAFPWEGRNALDAAVAAYQNIALLRQQMKPSNRVHAIITNGGAEDFNEPHRLNQAELSDLIRHLALSKQSTASVIQTAAMKFTPTRRKGYRV
ncbi:peptidase M20 domain-containing protein 2 [Trichonephila inaurata madagascariensis]|uniref:Peptidase M20 domain-containing protein 2 n=1 Tax=Trichonephila inaurata madagascariensis TaxID=2747483 RepID=A0A8X6Y8J7_9ARAC|nr:peptidase M20 domain-containing protein 2 [Trichonephila inaurata madagascariensis]